MFHLSLPVTAFAECLAFYRDCFDAEIVMLSNRAANLYVFGGQLTLHDDPHSPIGPAQRRAMHFGHVVTTEEWFAIRDRLEASCWTLLRCVEPAQSGSSRGKLLVADPSGNIVEVNSGLPVAGRG
jgi:extradiol dioxygenase family protein